MRIRLPGFGRKPLTDKVDEDDVSRGRDKGGKYVEHLRNIRQRSNYDGPSEIHSSYIGRCEGSDSGRSGKGNGDTGSDFQRDDIASRALKATSRSASNDTNYASNIFVAGRNISNSFIPSASPTNLRRNDVDQRDQEEKNKKVRVKPHSAFPTPMYMNETDLYQCMMSGSSEFEFLTSFLNPSTNATRRAKIPQIVQRQFGSPKEDGRVGSLRLEVLGCVGLDRVKPEVSVYAVCGDCAFTTDIIEGNRSPMWPNSANRAAVFPLHHAYARVFIGVFDVKPQKEKEADHLCGRVTIDIASLRPDTEYDVTFPLRASSFIYDRRPRGVVRVRFSLHWFSERSALLSYLKRPRNPLAFSRQAKKFPTIPCGDPKTFRNVAVTVHGQDFPGKFTRSAFRATMREFNLSQQNIRFLLKVLVLDCILYENPFMSFYLFSTSLYCVYLNSIRLAPPFFVGWLIYLLVENNVYFTCSPEGNLGYQGVTIQELFFALLFDGKNDKYKMSPILVKKRPRRQVVGEDGKYMDIELHNHREFPFSEKFEYPKFSAADAIASDPSTNKKLKGKNRDKGASPVDLNSGQETRKTRRLSIYTAPEGKDEEFDDESEEENQEVDDEDGDGMLDEAEYGYENMEDSDEEDDDDAERSTLKKRRSRILEAGKASKHRRIRVGPEQNNDKSGAAKQPPQKHLSKVENMLHRVSKNISVEHVHFPPPQLQTQLGKEINAKGPAGDVLTAKERKHYDEFDKLLGYRLKNPNPIVRITSSFLGPLMRIIRIVIYGFRISFNVCTWRDPYLTFWMFTFLCTLLLVLLIFPWRTFFFVSSFILLGPQNIAVRKYLERRANRREQEEREEKEREALKAQLKVNDPLGVAQSQSQQSKLSSVSDSTKSKEKGGKKKRLWGFGRKSEEQVDEQEDEIKEVEMFRSPRPAFIAHSKSNKRAQQVPRDVAVPYFRFRKDRFYDWPPDPTVSRATPMVVATRLHEEKKGGLHQNNGIPNRHRVARHYQDINEPRGLRNRRGGTREKYSRDEMNYEYGS